MEQEIVINLPLNEKGIPTAMKTASKMNGVTKVEIIRVKSHLVVTGVGVDSVELAKSLRKIFSFAQIVSVRNVTKSQRETMEEAGFAENDFRHQTYYNYPTQPYYQPYYNYTAVPVQEPDLSPICSIM